MNNGAFGENFPYSNFHDLNMDWIIKIAKDFLDQYTHIQEVIANGEQSLQDLTTSGLEQLQNKADALEALLQQWYDTHSEDIANQLADALNDLNDWYNTHSEDIADQLVDAIADFNTAAETKSRALLDSWPADYSELVTGYNNLKSDLSDVWEEKEKITPSNPRCIVTNPGYYNNSGEIAGTSDGHKCIKFSVSDNVVSLMFSQTTPPGFTYGYIKHKNGTYTGIGFGVAGENIIYLTDAIEIGFNLFNSNGVATYCELSYNFGKRTMDDLYIYKITSQHPDVEQGLYTAEGTAIQSPEHKRIKIDASNYRTFECDAIITSGFTYGTLEHKDGTFTSINRYAGFKQFDLSDVKYVYFNFFSGDNYPKYFIMKKESTMLDRNIAKYKTACRKPFNFNNKTAVFVGDSIAYGYTSATTNVHGTGDFPTLFSEIVGLSHENDALGGACFCSGMNDIKTIVKQVEDANNCDYLFIEGGINDWQTGATHQQFETTISNLCDYINNNINQNTKVIWITPINHGGWDVAHTIYANMTVQEVRNIMTRVVLSKDIYARFSIIQGNEFNFPEYGDNETYISAMYGDRLHPSALGYKSLYVAGLQNALC